jgi:hypothetical protein
VEHARVEEAHLAGGEHGHDRRRGGTGGHRPHHIYETIVEGQKGGLPKQAAHMHYTSSHMLHMMTHAISLLAPLVVGALDAADEAVQPKKQKKQKTKLTEDLADVRRAWESFGALCIWFGLVMRPEFTLASVIELDVAIYQHATLFGQVKSYAAGGLWKLKHHLVQHIPVDILYFGPPRNYWCMRFEAMNQVFKRFVTSSNYSNVLKRCVDLWSMKSAWNMRSGSASAWGDTAAIRQSEYSSFVNPACATGSHELDTVHQELFVRYFPFAAELSSSSVTILYHLGHRYVAYGTWVLHSARGAGAPYLAQLGAMFQVRDEFFMILHNYVTVDVLAAWDQFGRVVIAPGVLEAARPFCLSELRRVDSLDITPMRLVAHSDVQSATVSDTVLQPMR